MNKNQHILDYLKDYYELEIDPNYAVLLKGKWGAGKTWLIKNFFGVGHKKSEYKSLYISLYGVSSNKEIEEQIFQQLHPILASKGMRFIGKTVKGLVRATAKIDLDADGTSDGSISLAIPDVNVFDYLKKTEEHILIFDDLERCSIDINNILGYINFFVEHKGYKVIILANEEEILESHQDKESQSYQRIKEKLIGQEFEIKSNSYDALSYFLNEVVNKKFQEILKSNFDRILAIYELSEYDNLRSLRQGIHGFVRFILLLPEDAQDKPELLDSLLNLYFSFFFEIKSGQILPKDISSEYMWNSNKDNENKFIALTQKYKFIDFSDFIFTDKDWQNLVSGQLIKEEDLQISLKNSKYFQDENTKDWIRLWHFIYLNDEDFFKLRDKVWNEFINKKAFEIDEIYHIVGIFLLLADNGLIDKSKKEIFDLSLEYLASQSLNGSDLFEYRRKNPFFYTEQASNGLMFHGRYTKEFKDFSSEFRKQQDLAIEDSFNNIADKLIPLMRSNPGEFVSSITLNNHHPSPYAEIPVFQHIDPSSFFEALFSMSHQDRLQVGFGLRERYKFRQINPKLKVELEFLRTLQNLIHSKVTECAGMVTGFCMKQLDEAYIQAALDNLEGDESPIVVS